MAHVIFQGRIIQSSQACKCEGNNLKVKFVTPRSKAMKVPDGPYHVLLVVNETVIITLSKPFYVINPKAKGLDRADMEGENVIEWVGKYSKPFRPEDVEKFIPESWMVNAPTTCIPITEIQMQHLMLFLSSFKYAYSGSEEIARYGFRW